MFFGYQDKVVEESPRLRALIFIAIIAALSGCVIPVPAGSNNASLPPTMAQIDESSLVGEFAFPNYCAADVNVFGVTVPLAVLNVRCRGSVRLSDDGTHLFLYGTKDNPENINLLSIDPISNFSSAIDAPRASRTTAFPHGIGYSLLVLRDDIVVDTRTGDRLKLHASTLTPAVPTDFDLVAEEPDKRVYSADRTIPAFQAWRGSPFGSIVRDPFGSGREVYVSGTNGEPQFEWPIEGSARFFMDDGSPAPIPGPGDKSLAKLLKIENRIGGEVLGDGWYLNRRYGPGWTHLIAQSEDGRSAIWGWNSEDGTSAGYGVFHVESEMPIWKREFEIGRPHIGFTREPNYRVFERRSGRIAGEAAYTLFNASSGDLVDEVAESGAQIWPMTKPLSVPENEIGPVYCKSSSTECAENKSHVAWYSNERDGKAEVFVVAKGSGSLIFRKQLELSMKNPHARKVSIDLAKDANRIAILSRDGIVRIFEF